MTLSSVGDEILGLKIAIKISAAHDEDDGEFFSSLLLPVSYQLSSYLYKSLFFFECCICNAVSFFFFFLAKHM